MNRTALAWGRLARLSLAPSAAADVLAGLILGGFGSFPREPAVVALVLASLCVYHGGMVLNDWVDRAADAHERPDRPLPSGAISARSALTAACVLFASSVFFGSLVSWRAAAWLAGLVALVASYDLFGRGAWLGPLLLGACRAANLGLGVMYLATLAEQPTRFAPQHAVFAVAIYGAYVTCASRIARLEDARGDDEIGTTPRWALFGCSVLLVAAACRPEVSAWIGRPDAVALVLACAGAFALMRAALTVKTWTRALCGRVTGLALRRLLIFTAILALASRDTSRDAWIVAALILSGFAVSAALRRVFPPT